MLPGGLRAGVRVQITALGLALHLALPWHGADSPPSQPTNNVHQAREGPLWANHLQRPFFHPSISHLQISSISQSFGFFPSTFQPSYSQPPYNQGGYSQGYTAPPPPPPPPPAYNYGSYGGYNPAPYTPPPPPTAQTYPQPSYNQYQQVGARPGANWMERLPWAPPGCVFPDSSAWLSLKRQPAGLGLAFIWCSHSIWSTLLHWLLGNWYPSPLHSPASKGEGLA